MKTNTTIVLLAACGGLAFSVGCSKSEEPTPPADQTPQTPVSAAPAQPEQDAAEQVAAQEGVVEQLTETAAAAVQDTDQIQTLIDTATKLTGENKYEEALKVLGELASLELSPEQQTVVDGLKKTVEEQAAKAVADEAAATATEAIGNVLGGDK